MYSTLDGKAQYANVRGSAQWEGVYSLGECRRGVPVFFKAVAILLSMAFYPQRLFCRELFVIGQS